MDSDPAIGFTDGTEVNEITLHDKLNYPNYAPCYLSNGVQQNTLVPANTPPFTEVTLTFQPYRRMEPVSAVTLHRMEGT